MPGWWNGRHRRLKISRSIGRAGSSPASGTNAGVSIMDNTEDFYSFNVGSIPARRTM